MPIKIATYRPPNPELERLLRECRDARHAPRTRPLTREDDQRRPERPRRRLVLTNARVAVITGASCAIAAAFATLAFLDLAEMQGQDRERAVQISVIVASFLAILWLATVASLPGVRR